MTSRNTGYDREHRGLIRRIRVSVGIIILAIAAFSLVMGFALVRDNGMGPTVKSGSLVAYLRLSRDFRRGDAVCIRLPDGNTAVRRVVAVAGDSVELRNGLTYINGLAERGSYSFTRTDPRPEGITYPVILRQGELFLLGDAREEAYDSRDFGVVKTSDVFGKVIG